MSTENGSSILDCVISVSALKLAVSSLPKALSHMRLVCHCQALAGGSFSSHCLYYHDLLLFTCQEPSLTF